MFDQSALKMTRHEQEDKGFGETSTSQLDLTVQTSKPNSNKFTEQSNVDITCIQDCTVAAVVPDQITGGNGIDIE